MFVAFDSALLAVLEVIGLSSGRRNRNTDNKDMTVEEAGKKGGQKVRKLIQEGKEHEEES
jgi:hypothetical protein